MLKKLCFMCMVFVSGFSLEWDIESFTQGGIVQDIVNGFNAGQAVVAWIESEDGEELSPLHLYTVARNLDENIWGDVTELTFLVDELNFTEMNELHFNITNNDLVIISFIGTYMDGGQSLHNVCAAVYDPSEGQTKWINTILATGSTALDKFSSLGVSANEARDVLSFASYISNTLQFNVTFYDYDKISIGVTDGDVFYIPHAYRTLI